MIYVFDIDGTICTEDGPVENRLPYNHRIESINYLYGQGHTISFFTSRGMKSTNNDPVASDLKYRALTEKQLKDWGVNYHNLYFGKPNADVYVDNKGSSDLDFFRDIELTRLFE